jgi:hypothetical protein
MYDMAGGDSRISYVNHIYDRPGHFVDFSYFRVFEKIALKVLRDSPNGHQIA